MFWSVFSEFEWCVGGVLVVVWLGFGCIFCGVLVMFWLCFWLCVGRVLVCCLLLCMALLMFWLCLCLCFGCCLVWFGCDLYYVFKSFLLGLGWASVCAFS